jgi:hypothetical protein
MKDATSLRSSILAWCCRLCMALVALLGSGTGFAGEGATAIALVSPGTTEWTDDATLTALAAELLACKDTPVLECRERHRERARIVDHVYDLFAVPIPEEVDDTLLSGVTRRDGKAVATLRKVAFRAREGPHAVVIYERSSLRATLHIVTRHKLHRAPLRLRAGVARHPDITRAVQWIRRCLLGRWARHAQSSIE